MRHLPDPGLDLAALEQYETETAECGTDVGPYRKLHVVPDANRLLCHMEAETLPLLPLRRGRRANAWTNYRQTPDMPPSR